MGEGREGGKTVGEEKGEKRRVVRAKAATNTISSLLNKVHGAKIPAT